MVTTEVKGNSFDYRPSVVGRFARVVLPLLQTVLPGFVYDAVYKSLYLFYKIALRVIYFFKMQFVKVFGTKEDVLKTSLTWRLLPFSMGGRRALENAFDLTLEADKKKVSGALVECGVAEGGTAAMMALSNRSIGLMSREKWFFDSFEGLPEPTKNDYVGDRTGHFIRPLPKGSCLGKIEQVSELFFDQLGFSPDDVHLVKGWFQDTLPVHRHSIGPICILRLDGDWYESTKVPLENLFDQVSPGGFVIVDDYSTCFGSRRAVDEFRLSRGIVSPLVPDGRGGVWFEK